MAVPVVAYGHALQQEPVYTGDQSWEWSFDFEINGVAYTAKLTATRLDNEEFSVEMVIAFAALPTQGIKWFDGVVRYDHTHAEWNLYTEGITKVLEAEWNMDFEIENGSLKYTYVEPGQEESNSYFMVNYFPLEVYDAAYTISIAAGTTHIEWNTTTKEGRVMDPVKFSDSERHCWDSAINQFADRVCE